MRHMGEAQGNGAREDDAVKSGSVGAGIDGDDTLVGRLVNDRFRVIARIARGGMGKVYKAEQLPLGRLVALKVLDVHYRGDQDPDFHKRFFLEASICAKLTNPHTVTIFDYGRTEDDIYFIAMELLEGRTLRDAIRQEGPFHPERAVAITLQTCSSLQEAHKRGVVHRDLKPANIFLTAHGEQRDFVKVLDFGLVKEFTNPDAEATQTGLFMGSPKYMSPEQIQRRPIDPRTDIYSLGIILYTMLAGRVPFEGRTPVDILMAQINQPPPPFDEVAPDLQIPAPIEDVVRRMLRKDPDDRFGSVAEVRRALLEAAAQCGLLPQSGDVTLSGEWAQTQTGSMPSLVPGTMASGERSASHSFASADLRAAEGAGPGNKPWWILGGLLAVALVGAAVVFSGGGDSSPGEGVAVAGGEAAGGSAAAKAPDEETPKPDETPEQPATGAAEAPKPAGATGEAAGGEQEVPAPKVARVLLVLDSVPPGATVQVGEKTYGPTPVEVELVGEQATPGRSLELRFTKTGYYEYTASRVVVEGEPIRVTARLAVYS